MKYQESLAKKQKFCNVKFFICVSSIHRHRGRSICCTQHVRHFRWVTCTPKKWILSSTLRLILLLTRTRSTVLLIRDSHSNLIEVIAALAEKVWSGHACSMPRGDQTWSLDDLPLCAIWMWNRPFKCCTGRGAVVCCLPLWVILLELRSWEIRMCYRAVDKVAKALALQTLALMKLCVWLEPRRNVLNLLLF